MDMYNVSENITFDTLNDTLNNSLETPLCSTSSSLNPALNIPNAVSILQGSIILLGGITGFLLNSFLLFLIISRKSLHHHSYYLALQIIIVEIFYAILTAPVIFSVSIKSSAAVWYLGKEMCQIYGIMNDGFAISRFLLTLVLTMDRVLSVFTPFVYERHGEKITWCMSLIVWILTLIRTVLPLTGILNCYAYIPTFKLCTSSPNCSRECFILFVIGASVVIIFGSFVPVILYVALFYKARRLSSRQIPSNQLDIHERNKRVSITIFLLLLSVIGCSMPAYVLYLAQFAFQGGNTVLFIFQMLVGRVAFNLLPVIDAIAIMRNRDVMEQIRKCFSTWKYTLQQIRRRYCCHDRPDRTQDIKVLSSGGISGPFDSASADQPNSKDFETRVAKMLNGGSEDLATKGH